MRTSVDALILASAFLQGASLASGQPLTGKVQKPPLEARIEIDEREQYFTVRLFLKNVKDASIDVAYGRGDKGLEVLPHFNFGRDEDIYISPPIYLKRPKQGLSQDVIMKPNVMRIPAGKEVLYGTFTMGYPPIAKEQVDDLFTTLSLEQPCTTVEAKPVRLKIPAQKSGAAAIGVVTGQKPQAPDSPGQWVASDNGDLSLRLRFKSANLARRESIFVIAEIRNNRTGPVTILRPFGDPYVAEAVQLRIWGEQGQIKYTGPTYDYDLNAKAFVTLGANEIVSDTLELPVRHFAETAKAGNYTIRYGYAYDGTWDKKVAGEGVTGIWHGAICSREVQLTKSDETATVPVEKPDRASLDKDLRALVALDGILKEKPDDQAARAQAKELATRLAPDLRGNPLVMRLLVTTRALKDGTSLAAAEKLLGPPTRKTDQDVGWYFNPSGRHVAPYIHAKVAKEGLEEWSFTNR